MGHIWRHRCGTARSLTGHAYMPGAVDSLPKQGDLFTRSHLRGCRLWDVRVGHPMRSTRQLSESNGGTRHVDETGEYAVRLGGVPACGVGRTCGGFTVPSQLALARVRPSGANATETTRSIRVPATMGPV